MLIVITSLTLLGLFAGALARLIVPGRQRMSIWMTILLGIVGSFLGGFLGYALFGKDWQEGALQPAGLFGSVLGAVVVLLIWTRLDRDRFARRRHSRPRGVVVYRRGF